MSQVNDIYETEWGWGDKNERKKNRWLWNDFAQCE